MADDHVMSTEETRHPPMFEVIAEEEARRRMRSVRLDATLEQYRQQLEAGLEAVQQGKRFHVRPPSQTPAEVKALQSAIKRVAKGNPFHMDVRFDRADEGFIVRQATAQEHQRAVARGQALTAAKAKQKAQGTIAQAIMAPPLAPEGEGLEGAPLVEPPPVQEAPSQPKRRQREAARRTGGRKR
jgi:hypothetical protein